MSKKRDLLSLTRRRRVAPERADSFGSERASGYNGERYTRADCEAWIAWLRSHDYQPDLLISVERVPWQPVVLANALDKLMAEFGRWWGRRHRAGPDGTLGWLDYFLVTAVSEGGHASHGHVVVNASLLPGDEHKLKKLAAKRRLKVEVTRNSDKWLEGKRGVSQHRCKLEYAVEHLLNAGSTYRVGASEKTLRVRRARQDFRAWIRSRARSA